MLVDDEMIDFEAIFGICCSRGSSYKIGFYMTIRWGDTAVKEIFLAKWSK